MGRRYVAHAYQGGPARISAPHQGPGVGPFQESVHGRRQELRGLDEKETETRSTTASS